MKFSTLCFAIIFLSAIGVVACNKNNVTGPANDTVFEGYYRNGWELSSFVPCSSDQTLGDGIEYWLTISPDIDLGDIKKQWLIILFGDLSDEVSETGIYIHFKGELSPTRRAPNGYGHLGLYTNEVIVTQFLDVSLDDKCPSE